MRRIKKINKWLIVLLIATIAVTFTAGANFLFKEKMPRKIVLIPKSISPHFEFWQTVKMGAEQAAKEENVAIETRGSEFEINVEEQKRIFKETIAEHPDIILVAASDTHALSDLIKEAIKKRIIILTVDSKAEGVEGIKHVATNNVEAAGALTQYMADSIGGRGEVIMVNFVEGTSTAKEREQGYKDAIKKYPDITVHPTVYTEGTVQGAYKIAKQIIKEYPNLKAIIGGNQQAADGICDAVTEMGVAGKVKIVGFDSSDTIIYALEKDVMSGIIVQKPFNMGYLAVKYGIQMYQGKDVPDFIDTGYKFINKGTLYLTENQKLLYPIIR